MLLRQNILLPRKIGKGCWNCTLTGLKIKKMVYIRMETEKEIEYKSKSTIMEMRNIIKNQERVIEELMLEKLYPKEECI
jgi:hypothetical protein